MTDRDEILARARGLLTEREFDSCEARAEAFESLRERVDEDSDGGEALLFDLAMIEAEAHERARGAAPWAGDEADALLTAWTRVVAGGTVSERGAQYRRALEALSAALSDRSLDATPPVATAAWLALGRGCLAIEDRALIERALACWTRACAGARGTTRGRAALVALELSGHAGDAARAKDAADVLWSLRDAERIVPEERADLLAPVWQVRMALDEVDEARAAAEAWLALERALDAGAHEGRVGREADALGALAECAAAQGDLKAARAALARRLAIAERLLEARPGDAFALARRDEAREAVETLESLAAGR